MGRDSGVRVSGVSGGRVVTVRGDGGHCWGWCGGGWNGRWCEVADVVGGGCCGCGGCGGCGWCGWCFGGNLDDGVGGWFVFGR